VAPILEAINGGRGASEPPAGEAARTGAAQSDIAPRGTSLREDDVQNGVAQNGVAPGALAENDADEDIEEYDDDLIEIIDDAEVIPRAAAVARAIEPAAFGAAVDRRPSAPSAPRTAPAQPAPAADAVSAEVVAARPVVPTDVARVRGQRRELRHSPFIELLDTSLKLG